MAIHQGLRKLSLRARVAVATLGALVVINGQAGVARAQAAVAMAQLAQVEITPTSAGFPGGAMFQRLLNWAGQFGLWASVASIVLGAGVWGFSQNFGNGLQAGKGKLMVAGGAIGAVLTGLAATIVNTLFSAARG